MQRRLFIFSKEEKAKMNARIKHDKPVTWANIYRTWAMLGIIKNTGPAEEFRARKKYLEPMLKSGRVVKIRTGLYRLADNWTEIKT